MATVYTAYQGVEVVDTQHEVPCRHPRWGYDPSRLATLKGASLLMLADGILLVVCDECGYNGLTAGEPYVKPEGDYKPIINQADSLLAHINGMHHPNKPNRNLTLYTDAEIRVAIKIWLKWKGTGIKNWTQEACSELERRGFKPHTTEHWNPGQLGGLVRDYLKKEPFKNIKAGPMDADDKATLEAMVQKAAEAASGRTGTHVADNVRITQRGTPKQSRSEHKPVDFAGIIAASEAAKQKQERPEEEEPVPNPKLTFASQTPVKAAIVVDTSDDIDEMVEPDHEPATRSTAVREIVVESPFKHVADLPDGSPMFTYNGTLMVGKAVKDVSI